MLGAGMAGLACARALAGRGFRVTVLEGRRRIGGRIDTHRLHGLAIEFGAAVIHDPAGNPLVPLARRFRAPLKKARYDDVALFDSRGRLVTPSQTRQTLLEFKRTVDHAVRRAGGSSRPVPVAEFLKKSPRPDERSRLLWQWVQSAWVVVSGAEMNALDARFYDESSTIGQYEYFLPGGYDALPRGLARGLDIRLGETVKEVSTDERRVTVRTGHSLFEADAALVTFPLGVLKKESVRFRPALPKKKREAIRRMGFGLLNKAVLIFRAPFQRPPQDFLGFASRMKGEFPMMVNHSMMRERPVFVALTGGLFAGNLEKMPEAEAKGRLLEILAGMLKARLPKVLDFQRTGWASDPFSRGSYSYPACGSSPEDYDMLAEPVGDRLFFAGEATFRKAPATVHGAYLSGLRAAREIAGRFGVTLKHDRR